MFVTSLTDRELATVIQALRYWRNNRRDHRRKDDLLNLEETDLLLSKLGLGTGTALPSDDLLGGTFPH